MMMTGKELLAELQKLSAQALDNPVRVSVRDGDGFHVESELQDVSWQGNHISLEGE